MPYDFEFDLRIRAPRPTVFEKLLRIEHLARWFCGWCRIEPKVGGKFLFGGETCLVLPEGRGWETTIDEGDVLRRFAFTWPIHGQATRVAYELEDEGSETTLLRASHRGVPMRESSCGTLHDAWRMCLGNLKSISEGRGDSVRPDHSPVTPDALKLSNLIEAPADQTFRALVDPAQVDRWITGSPPPSRVAALEPNVRIALEWSQGETAAQVDLRLEAKSSGTAVYLVKTGYPPGHEQEIVRDRGAWSDRLVCLKNLVEAGDVGFVNAYEAQVRET